MIAFLARQKFRFDVGQGLANAISLGLLTVSAAPHIGYWVGAPSWLIAVAILPVSLFLIWFAGYVWERVGGFREYQSQINAHNEILSRLSDRL